MSLEKILEGIDQVELSGQLMEATIADYCKHYEVEPSKFDGAVKAFALKAVADVAMASQLAALVGEKIDFDELLLRMNFGEQDADLSLMQKRLIEAYREPLVLSVSRGIYDKRFVAMEKWIRRASQAQA